MCRCLYCVFVKKFIDGLLGKKKKTNVQHNMTQNSYKPLIKNNEMKLNLNSELNYTDLKNGK